MLQSDVELLIATKTMVAGIWEELAELCSTLTSFLLLSLGLYGSCEGSVGGPSALSMVFILCNPHVQLLISRKTVLFYALVGCLPMHQWHWWPL